MTTFDFYKNRALSFKNTIKFIDREQLILNSQPDYHYAKIVNASFAIEDYLKAILAIERPQVDYAKTHKIKSLFNVLSRDTKAKIIEQYNKSTAFVPLSSLLKEDWLTAGELENVKPVHSRELKSYGESLKCLADVLDKYSNVLNS